MRIHYLVVEGEARLPAIMVSVPKRLFKRAVDRNLLKRRIREAYRLNKHILTEEPGLHSSNTQLQLVLQYRGRDISDYASIESSLKNGLEKLKTRLTEEGSGVDYPASQTDG